MEVVLLMKGIFRAFLLVILNDKCLLLVGAEGRTGSLPSLSTFTAIERILWLHEVGDQVDKIETMTLN